MWKQLRSVNNLGLLKRENISRIVSFVAYTLNILILHTLAGTVLNVNFALLHGMYMYTLFLGLSKRFVLGVSVRHNGIFPCLIHLDHLVSLWQLSVTNIVFGLQTIADIIRTCLGPKAMLKVSLAHSLLSYLIIISKSILNVFSRIQGLYLISPT